MRACFKNSQDALCFDCRGFDDEPFISLVEYKYKDVLRIQLVAAISHLVGLCARDLRYV